MMEFEKQSFPEKSGIYMVDREKLGKWYRYYNAETKDWGFCSWELDEAYEKRDSKSPLGFLPWKGPFNFNKKIAVAEPVVTDLPLASKKSKTVAPKQQTVVKKPRTRIASKAQKSTKPTMANGTIFYRQDRQKWVAVWDGKQEAARPTKEACIAFLKKKYSFTDVIILDQSA
jgi:hypothetical protein